MPEKKIVLYMHAGSGNHGCEAIVNSLCHMLKDKPLVITNSEEEDRKYSLAGRDGGALCELAEERHFSRHKFAHVLYYGWRKLTGDGESFIRYRYRAVFDRPLSRYAGKRCGKETRGNSAAGNRTAGELQAGQGQAGRQQTEVRQQSVRQQTGGRRQQTEGQRQSVCQQTEGQRQNVRQAGGRKPGKMQYPLAVSIGGDNYCYDVMVKDLILANRAFHDRGARTVLLGCSIEPELLISGGSGGKGEYVQGGESRKKESMDAASEERRKKLAMDMNLYDLIIARESLTYEALKEVVPESKLRLIPDPAFTLGVKELPLPEGFAKGNTLGLNVSPMIQGSEGKAGITMENYKALIEHVIRTTDMQIALIPHVVWARNDDRKPLKELYEAYRDSGRVVWTGDGSCEELKGYIARCRMFIGARTHATIAAYSSLVPTLVVGYSVKAKGIAKDLFGSYENYVIPVQQLRERDDLIGAFEWLRDYEEDIRQDLRRVMPGYKERALSSGKEVERLWEELNMRQKI